MNGLSTFTGCGPFYAAVPGSIGSWTKCPFQRGKTILEVEALLLGNTAAAVIGAIALLIPSNSVDRSAGAARAQTRCATAALSTTRQRRSVLARRMLAAEFRYSLFRLRAERKRALDSVRKSQHAEVYNYLVDLEFGGKKAGGRRTAGRLKCVYFRCWLTIFVISNIDT